MRLTHTAHHSVNFKYDLNHSYFLWHDPPIGHEEHLQPQDDFPFFLSFTSTATTAASTIIITNVIITVAKFASIHENIKSQFLSSEKITYNNQFVFNFVDSLYGRNIIYIINTNTKTDIMTPTIFIFPVNMFPN